MYLPFPYKYIEKIGQGSYGTVVKAFDKTRGAKVAIKIIASNKYNEPFNLSILRESKIAMLLQQEIYSPNIVETYDVIMEHEQLRTNTGTGDAVKDDEFRILIVQELMEYDLSTFIKKYGSVLGPVEIRIIMQQIIKGCSTLHELGIIHRDLKSSNILINGDLTVKICDFGLSRYHNFSSVTQNQHKQQLQQMPLTKQLTGLVVTQAYRAPELLLDGHDKRNYTNAIDMWSVGCIFHELITKKPLVPPGAWLDYQMSIIFTLLGTACRENYPHFYKKLSGSSKSYVDSKEKLVKAPQIMKHWIMNVHKFYDLEGFSLLTKLLCMDPEDRISSDKALKHPFVNQHYPYFVNINGINAAYLDDYFAFELVGDEGPEGFIFKELQDLLTPQLNPSPNFNSQNEEEQKDKDIQDLMSKYYEFYENKDIIDFNHYSDSESDDEDDNGSAVTEDQYELPLMGIFPNENLIPNKNAFQLVGNDKEYILSKTVG